MHDVEELERTSRQRESLPAPSGGDERSASSAGKPTARRSDTNEAPQATPSPPPRPAEAVGEKRSEPEEPRQPARRPVLRWALFALLPLALIAGGYWYVAGGQVMSMDDAFVEADKVGVSTDVSGIVKEVDVAENALLMDGRATLTMLKSRTTMSCNELSERLSVACRSRRAFTCASTASSDSPGEAASSARVYSSVCSIPGTTSAS